MRRRVAKIIMPAVKWLAYRQIPSESVLCGLIDWAIRNESRYGRMASHTMVKTTSVLRDQHGGYAAICHYTTDESSSPFARWWRPDERFSQFNALVCDTAYSPIYWHDRTIITTKRAYRPVSIWHKSLSQCVFFIEQDGTRYACEALSLDILIARRIRRPRIYEPISHRGRLLSDEERKSAIELKQEYRIMDEVTAPYELAMDIQQWLDYMKEAYNEYMNDPETHREVSRRLARGGVYAVESIRNRWYDRRRWEYMGHISIDLVSGKIDHDMYDVPRQLYHSAVAQAQQFAQVLRLPDFDVEQEGNSYMYRIIAGVKSGGYEESPSHLLTFHRKPKRVCRTPQRHFQNCQACRHWAKAGKNIGNCRSNTTREKILCMNAEHEEGRDGHEPGVLRTHATFGCTEFSPKE